MWVLVWLFFYFGFVWFGLVFFSDDLCDQCTKEWLLKSRIIQKNGCTITFRLPVMSIQLNWVLFLFVLLKKKWKLMTWYLEQRVIALKFCPLICIPLIEESFYVTEVGFHFTVVRRIYQSGGGTLPQCWQLITRDWENGVVWFFIQMKKSFPWAKELEICKEKRVRFYSSPDNFHIYFSVPHYSCSCKHFCNGRLLFHVLTVCLGLIFPLFLAKPMFGLFKLP